MYKQGKTGAIITIVVIVLVLGLIGIAAYLRTVADGNGGGFGNLGNFFGSPTTTPGTVGTTTIPAPGPETDLRVFRATFVTGFEGDNTTVTYEITYPRTSFSVSAAPEGAGLINLVEGNRTHTIRIFNNVGAGFQNSLEAYEGSGADEFCVGCKLVASTFRPIAGTDVRTWQSDTREVIIYKHDPGFVVIRLYRPSEAAKSVAQTLRITTTPGGTIGDQMPIKIYLVKDASTRCDLTVPQNYSIPRTSAPATAALNLLMQVGGYPEGSKLNSLSIRGGVAYADFNQATQSRGGSCFGAAARAQIRDTLMQFPTIKSVVISIDGEDDPSLIFQP